jgi:hypothetical protein
LGWAAPAREVDAYIVRCWRDRVPSERLLADARTPPPPPSPPEAPLVWADCVDPQGEPQTVAEALARLEQAQSTLRGMTTVLARAWERVTSESLYEEAGFATGAEAAEEILGMSHRSAQRLSKLGRGLEWYPEIDAAIQAGLAPRSAAALLEVVGDHDASAWLALAARVGRRELHRAVAAAGEERASARTLERYRKAMEIADRWAETPEGAAVLARPFGATAAGAAAVPADVRGGGAISSVEGGAPARAQETTDRANEPTDRAHEPTDRAQETTDRAHEATNDGGPRRGGVGPEGEARVEEAAVQEPTNAGGPPRRPAPGALGVALAHPEPAKFSGTSLRAPPEMLAAASWLLDTVILPRARGFARVKEQSGGRCTNPECGRRSLRTEAHHLIARSLGGPDEEWNGTGACRACHVRGLHAGRLAAVRVIAEGHDAVLWSWPDGRRVLRFRDEPGEGAQGP